MKRIFKSKPSPAMIVAIAALVVSIGGTAVAGPIAEISLNKGEKKQVRKISRNISGKVSNRRITKRAPGLAVASSGFANIANVANAANTATNAKNADSADNADNADQLDGKSADDIAMWAFVDTDGTLFRGSDGVTSSKVLTGRYNVNFPRNIDSCAYNATNAAVDGAPNPLPNEIALASLDADTVRVQTGQSADGALVDDEFMLVVTC